LPETGIAIMKTPAKRNIVEGINHMGDLYVAMPQIAMLIEAEYAEEALDKAYAEAMNLPGPPDDIPLPDDHDGYGIWWTNWTLKGNWLNFTICFEKHEMLYGWQIRCPDEATYYEVKEIMGSLLC
jgi:hypothetical protein